MGAGIKNAETKSIRAYIDTKVTADIKTTVASPGLDTKVISEKASVAYFTAQTETDAITAWVKNHVQQGGKGTDGSTGSTHADAGPFDYNANLSEVVLIVDNVYKTIAATADIDLAHGAGAAPIDGTDDTIIYAVCAYNNAGTPTLFVVAGTAAPALSAVPPLDAAILAVHDPFVRICNVTITRTGAATCTVAPATRLPRLWNATVPSC
jgi:hypothetical protein